jgi:hypothetical protein
VTNYPTIKFAAAGLVFGVALSVLSCGHYQNKNRASASPEPVPEAPSPSPMDLANYYGYIKRASVTCRDLPSAGAANEALTSQLPHAGELNRIIKRSTKTDTEGKTVGRRFITWSCCGKEGQSFAHIYGTDGSKFCDIIAATVDEALAFEKSHEQ